MANRLGPGLVAIAVVGALAAGIVFLSRANLARSNGPSHATGSGSSAVARGSGSRTSADRPPSPLFSTGFVDDSGFGLAYRFNAPISDRGSLEEVRRAMQGRAKRGIDHFRKQLERLPQLTSDRSELEMEEAQGQMFMGLLYMHDGEFEQAMPWLQHAYADHPDLPRELRANLGALRGIAALRRGEVENCIACMGPSSCIFPIARQAVHERTEGSREAIKYFTEYLQERPDDVGVRWLLNIAYMTLGEYPDKVPKAYLVPLDSFRSQLDPGRFSNIAPLVGLDTRGPNMYGGSAFDDFNGDGLLDVFVASYDIDMGASIFINRGDGTFEDRGASAGLREEGMSQNLTHADFDNDGDLDVLLTRGGWEDAARMSLLRNKGDATFEDVTVAAGLAEPIASQSAAWADFDNDGWLDVYIAGELRNERFDGRSRCRLYRNQGDGTFVDVAAKAGVLNEAWAKGAAWGDYDGDGWADLYVSNMKAPNRLYHNNGDGTFTDLARSLGVDAPLESFACWFWDFDNDGQLDIYVTGFGGWLYDYVQDLLGQPNKGERPRLYRNMGAEGFRDVTKETGLWRVLMPMGSNFGDIDNDGYLDFYLGTGRPPYSQLVPNVMYKNMGGQRFEDVTLATGTGHLQKGHSVSFADWDGDGDLDFFVEVGGTTPGDRGYNVLFQNPGHGRHWLGLRLVGTKTNRAAIGAKVRVDFREPNGSKRSLYREVNNGGSFGGNCLTVHAGLGEARKVEAVTVTWPVSKTVQTFRDIDADQTIEIREGDEAFRVLPKRVLTPPVAPVSSTAPPK